MKNFYQIHEFTIENARNHYKKLSEIVAREYETNDMNPHWIPGFIVTSAENRMQEALDFIYGEM